MSIRKNARTELERMALSISERMQGEGSEYEVSSAFSQPEKRRFLGSWEVTDHEVDGEDFPAAFARQSLKGIELIDPGYEARYIFRDGICMKRAHLSGRIMLEDGEASYEWILGMTLSWGIGPMGVLRCRPDLAYQATLIDGGVTAFRELENPGSETRISYSFEASGELILEEGSDRKILRRMG